MTVARPDTLSRRALDGTVRVFLSEALLLPTGLLIVAYLTRRLGPAQFGVYALAATLVAWVEWTVASMFSRATFKLVAEASDWRPVGAAIAHASLVAGAAAMLVLGAASVPIASALRDPALAVYLALFALDIPLFALAQAHRNILVGLGRFRARASTSAGRWLGKLVLVVLLVELTHSIAGAVLGSIGASAIELAIGRAYVQPSLRRPRGLSLAPLLGHAVPLFAFAVSMRALDKVDLFALRVLGGTLADAGAYGAAQNLAVVPGLFAASFSSILMATLAQRLAAGDAAGARAAARNALRVSLLLLPFAGIAAGASPGLVTLAFGPDFLAAAAPFRLLIFGAVGFVGISIATAIVTIAGRPAWTALAAAPLVPAALLADVLLIPRFGPVGASAATAGAAALGALITVGLVHHLWGVLPPAATAARSLVVTALAYAAATRWPTTGAMLGLQVAALALGAAGLLVLLGESDRAELAMVGSLVSASPARREGA